MAVTLVVNPGSSSKKYALYREGTAIFSMRFERTALGFEQCTEIGNTRQLCEGVSADTFGIALEHFLAAAIAAEVITSYDAVAVVAVRMVVPGTLFQKHCRIDDAYIRQLKEHEAAAPLHVPHTLRELAAVQKLLPRATQVAASDSAFHATLPDVARLYSIPGTDAVAHDVYRFGYHGLSVASVIRRHHAVIGYEPTRAVVCHIGSGVSVTAVKDGRSVETTMGYAPGSGLPMASRAGDVDAGALLALMQAKHWRPMDAELYLNTKGGLVGAAETSDLRQVIDRAAREEARARQALDTYLYHIARAVASATVPLGGMDSLIFTATAGERSSLVRSRIGAALTYLGVVIDVAKNESTHSADAVISSSEGRVKVAVIRTDEMGEMCRVAEGY
jgi:acetate kinase